MTDNNHPIIPPQELMQQWLGNYFGNVFNGELSDLEKYLVTQASQWGYEKRGADIEYELQKARDEELEACCEWLLNSAVDGAKTLEPYIAADPETFINAFRAARRPKPPSLAEEALKNLSEIRTTFKAAWGGNLIDEPIRRALERLKELEGQDDG